MFIRDTLKVTGLLLLLCAAPQVIAAPAQSMPEYKDEQFLKDERSAIRRVSALWESSLNKHKPEQTASLYDNSFHLFATLENKIDHYDGLMAYFTKLTSKQDFKVSFTNQNIRVYGAAAVNSGLYHFSYMDNGKRVDIPARFTFVYILTPEGWRIVDHHSSTLPE